MEEAAAPRPAGRPAPFACCCAALLQMSRTAGEAGAVSSSRTAPPRPLSASHLLPPSVYCFILCTIYKFILPAVAAPSGTPPGQRKCALTQGLCLGVAGTSGVGWGGGRPPPNEMHWIHKGNDDLSMAVHASNLLMLLRGAEGQHGQHGQPRHVLPPWK